MDPTAENYTAGNYTAGFPSFWEGGVPKGRGGRVRDKVYSLFLLKR